MNKKFMRFGMLFLMGMAASVILLNACSKEDFDFSKFSTPELHPELAAPLIHSNLSLRQLLPSGGLIVEDSISHNLQLVYETAVFSKKAEDYIQIPQQQETFTKTSLNLPLPTGTSITLPYDEYLDFDPPSGGQRIDSIVFKSGKIHLAIQSNINHSGSIEISLPFVTRNGSPLQTVIAHTYTGGSQVSNQVELDLAGYKVGLNTLTGGVKAMLVHFVLKLEGDNNPDLSPYTFSLEARLSQLQFSKIFGYLGVYEYGMKDSIELSIFKNNFNGQIQFGDLSITMKTRNSIGMPMHLEVNELKAYSSKNAPYVVDITANPGFINPIRFPSPTAAQAGLSIDTMYTFDASTCNLVQALNIAPTWVKFDINGKSNPDENPALSNFILDSSRYSVKVRIVLPLFGSISGFWMADTLNFNFHEVNDIEEFAFVMSTVNRFPLDIWLQAYFTDEQFQVLDSLMYSGGHYLVRAAAVGPPPDYYVPLFPPPPKHTFYPYPFNRERLKRLSSASKVIVKAGLNTYDNNLVKIYNDYDLDLRMGARLKVSY